MSHIKPQVIPSLRPSEYLFIKSLVSKSPEFALPLFNHLGVTSFPTLSVSYLIIPNLTEGKAHNPMVHHVSSHYSDKDSAFVLPPCGEIHRLSRLAHVKVRVDFQLNLTHSPTFVLRLRAWKSVEGEARIFSSLSEPSFHKWKPQHSGILKGISIRILPTLSNNAKAALHFWRRSGCFRSPR